MLLNGSIRAMFYEYQVKQTGKTEKVKEIGQWIHSVSNAQNNHFGSLPELQTLVNIEGKNSSHMREWNYLKMVFLL